MAQSQDWGSPEPLCRFHLKNLLGLWDLMATTCLRTAGKRLERGPLWVLLPALSQLPDLFQGRRK